DVSSHSAASRQSLPRRVLSTVISAVSPCRLSRATSRVSDISTEPPLPSPPSEPANNAPDTHLDSMSDTPSAENLEGLITDPREVDVPEGEAEAYSEPPAPSDDEGEPETNVQGTPWDDRKPPTQVMALEAYEDIQLLLFIPSVPGKRKRTVPKKINGWERRHLEQISSHLSLYTDKNSKTRGQWTESSVQAAVSHGAGKGGRHGRARGIRERARKYI
ncbi:hypothetical protein R3P38DRAFT_3452336, partial [Favolaschia claudopus]